MPGPTIRTQVLVPHLELSAANTDDAAGRLAELLAGPVVAVTGARAATAYGEHIAGDLGAALAEAGVTLATGASFGIEAAAARAVLAAGGRVIAALPCGANRPYPQAHSHLFSRIAETGVVLSMYPDGAATNRERFLERGQLVAAMSGAMVVVEAAQRSGAMAAAAAQHEAGRPLFAVPGPTTSAVSAGCHQLIKSGHAKLLTEFADLGTDLTGHQIVVSD